MAAQSLQARRCAWAVGSGDAGAIIEHWNGTRWTGMTFG